MLISNDMKLLRESLGFYYNIQAININLDFFDKITSKRISYYKLKNKTLCELGIAFIVNDEIYISFLKIDHGNDKFDKISPENFKFVYAEKLRPNTKFPINNLNDNYNYLKYEQIEKLTFDFCNELYNSELYRLKHILNSYLSDSFKTI